MSEENFIPFHRPSIGQEEFAAVNKVLSSGWLTTGPVTLEFEHEFASYVGCKHALALNSGTAALQLALDAIRLRAGEEVLVPTYTFTASAEVVTYFGARPVLCDSVPGGFNIDPEDVERRVTERTRAIIPVHVAGEPCQLDRLQGLAKRFGLHLIEDAAHALPASYRSARIGTISELTAFSFYATKPITTGEGGMLTTNNDEYAARIATMRLHGIGRDAWKRYSREGSWFYEVGNAGYKLNLSDLQGALGLAQLRKCDSFWERRRKIAQIYSDQFSRIEELEIPPDSAAGGKHSWHLYILRIRPDSLPIHRNAFIDELRKSGIGASVHFIPLHLHPFYANCYGYRPRDFPNAEDAYSRCISLPIYPGLIDEEVERVIRSVEHIVMKNRKRISIAAS